MKIRGAETALSFVMGNVSLENVEISSCSSRALSLPSQASLRLINCRFYNNYYVVNAGNAGQVNISSCVFERNHYAVQLRRTDLVHVEDSRFSDNAQGLYASAYYSHAAILIKRLRFYDSSVEMTGQSVFVEDCIFNSSNLAVHEQYRPHLSSVIIANSSFQLSHLAVHGQSSVIIANSSFRSSRVSVYIQRISPNSSVSIVGCSFRWFVGFGYQRVVDLYVAPSLRSVSLTGNTFEENDRAHCIKVHVSAASSHVDFGIISIMGNRFTNNSGANVVIIDDRAYSHLQLRRNVFQNPYCPFEIEVQSPWKGDYVINASENWWGSTNRTYISGRISDVFLDSTKAKASITSIYSDPKMTQLELLFPDLRSWNVIDRKVVGGELYRNVTLTSLDVPYFVNKTIYIPKGFQLQLKENATFHFAETRGIIIEGMYA